MTDASLPDLLHRWATFLYGSGALRWFSLGLVLAGLLVPLAPGVRRRFVGWGTGLGIAWVGLGPDWPSWAALLLGLAVCLPRRPPRWLTAWTVPVWLYMGMMEARYWQWGPMVTAGQATTLYVIGDSISSGMGRPGEVPWPVLLGQNYGVTVVNLAEPGATVRSALRQAEGIPGGVGLAVVLLEIGGNDLLGPTSAADFEVALRRLWKRSAAPAGNWCWWNCRS